MSEQRSLFLPLMIPIKAFPSSFVHLIFEWTKVENFNIHIYQSEKLEKVFIYRMERFTESLF